MKRLLTTFLLLALTISTWAADIIIKQDETRIDAIIAEVSETTIKYRKVSNPNGPLFVIKVDEIASIIYSNGEVQAYNTAPSTATQTPKADQVQPDNQPLTAYDAYWLYKLDEEKKAKAEKAKKDSIWAKKREEQKQNLKRFVFQAHVELSGMVSGKNGAEYNSFATASNWGGFGFDGVLGFRSPKRYNFFGIGFGFHGQFSKISDDYRSYYNNIMNYYYIDYYFFDGSSSNNRRDKVQLWYMPIYINDRIYIPISVDINPFIDLSFGGFAILGGKCGDHSYDRNLDYYGKSIEGGLFCRLGAGIEWKRLNFGVGYQVLSKPTGYYFATQHSAYFKVGYRFGKTNKEDKRMY